MSFDFCPLVNMNVFTSVSSAPGVIAGQAVVCLTVKADFMRTHQFLCHMNKSPVKNNIHKQLYFT